MGLKRKLTRACLLGALLCEGCATAGRSTYTVSQNLSVKVLDGSQPPREVASGSTEELGDHPVVLEKPGHHSVYLVPLVPRDGYQLDVKLLPVDRWLTEETLRHVNGRLGDLLSEVERIYGLLDARKYPEADEASRDLYMANPGVPYLGFLRASCLVMSGKNSEALSPLEAALRSSPNNKSGLKLYRTLTGRDWVSPDAGGTPNTSPGGSPAISPGGGANPGESKATGNKPTATGPENTGG